MSKISLEVTWKLVKNRQGKNLSVPKGITAGELLELLDVVENKEQVLVVYNGCPVFPDDPLEQDGQVILMPVLAGG